MKKTEQEVIDEVFKNLFEDLMPDGHRSRSGGARMKGLLRSDGSKCSGTCLPFRDRTPLTAFGEEPWPNGRNTRRRVIHTLQLPKRFGAGLAGLSDERMHGGDRTSLRRRP